jgi:hypothetical protein
MGTTSRTLNLLIVALLSFTAAGCEAIVTIFEAGVWVGVILVALAVLVIWFVARAFRRS